ncbi:hypothetical protein T492DRAFT_838615 [Pavlovales sp. CCMP2436]|nr:hypothetical protein T492DRAFT_838615 [Pavlovales sp. CCMP2436]
MSLLTRTKLTVARGARSLSGHNYRNFEHHEEWAKNKYKPAAFVFGFASIGLIVPAFGISFAQYAAPSPSHAIPIERSGRSRVPPTPRASPLARAHRHYPRY